MDYTKLILMCFFIIYSTIFISLFPNYSGLPSNILIPIVILLQVKYYFGDIIKPYTLPKDMIFTLIIIGFCILLVYITNLNMPYIKSIGMPYLNKITKISESLHK